MSDSQSPLCGHQSEVVKEAVGRLLDAKNELAALEQTVMDALDYAKEQDPGKSG